jgi:hypothetical protein
MKARAMTVGLLMILVPGCWSLEEPGRITSLPGELVPIAVGVAVYKEAQQVELNLEFVVSSRCVRVTPLDSYRFSLKRLDGTPEVLVEQFVSTRTKLIEHPRLVHGRYEIRVFHQDQTQRLVKKTFSIQEKNPLVLVDVPCLD